MGFRPRLGISGGGFLAFGHLEHNIGGVCRRAFRFWRADALDLYAGDTLAIHFDDGKPGIAKIKTLAALRNEAKLIENERSEERRVGEEGRSRWSPYH